MKSIESIYNYRVITDRLWTGGQPDEAELACLIDAGCEVVINLGLNNTEYAVENEALILKQRDIAYIHIPVVFEHPKSSDLSVFIKTLKKYRNKRVFVHCAANKRASVFVALYRLIEQQCDFDTEMNDMIKVWHPNECWKTFIDEQLSSMTWAMTREIK